eukprot:TRINITY_DN11653_c0_g2_i2.p1 TRINITY_DN11653_c0_g2~~TRINITY_DN11653_c0_g2_i2.p1  ORF type:complete len:129 (+),score=5.44 TRINITY_DN11653_c0_g2_i2:38-424(+)
MAFLNSSCMYSSQSPFTFSAPKEEKQRRPKPRNHTAKCFTPRTGEVVAIHTRSQTKEHNTAKQNYDHTFHSAPDGVRKTATHTQTRTIPPLQPPNARTSAGMPRRSTSSAFKLTNQLAIRIRIRKTAN